MKPIQLLNFAEGRWVRRPAAWAALRSAIDGEVVAEASSQGLDFAAMARFARDIGGPALRKLTFHERARLLKAMADRAHRAQGRSLYAFFSDRSHEG